MKKDKKGYYYYALRTKSTPLNAWLREQAAKEDCSINAFMKKILIKEMNLAKS